MLQREGGQPEGGWAAGASVEMLRSKAMALALLDWGGVKGRGKNRGKWWSLQPISTHKGIG